MIITTTATWRPELLRQTLQSFTNNLVGLDAANAIMLINVDPAPVGDPDRTDEVLNVARDFFGCLIYNTPDIASFPMAVKWLWTAVDKEHDAPFLHLEDDWVLTQRVELAPLLERFDADRNLTSIALRAYRDMAGGRVVLSPSLIRPSHAARMAAVMRADQDPEKSLRPWHKVRQMLNLKAAIWPDKRVVVRDIGREWMAHRGLAKNLEGGNRLTTWMEKAKVP